MRTEPLSSHQGRCLIGPLLITPQRFGDDRGWFSESWNQRRFDAAVGESAVSARQPLPLLKRCSPGLTSCQLPPGKAGAGLRWRIWDVVVDLRSFPSYGHGPA